MRAIARMGRVFLPSAFCLLTFTAQAAELPATEFDQMYADVEAYSMDPANNPDLAHGLVQIEYGDAKAYCPAWVYARDDLGQTPSDFEFQVARQMHERYRERFTKLHHSPLSIFKDFNLAMDAAIGIEGILRAYEHSPEEQYRDLAREYLDFARPLARHPGLIMNYHVEPYGPATVIAGAAWFYLEYARAVGPDDPNSAGYREVGLDIIRKMDRKLYSDAKQTYKYSVRPGYDFTYAYNDTVMVQALVRAYALTGERRYYDRALTLMDSMERDLWVPEEAGFLSAEPDPKYRKKYEKVGPQYNHGYMALSTQNYLVYGYLSLYEAGGFTDDELLEKAAVPLRFIRDRLWDRQGKIQHHITDAGISPPADYCMGCNFQTLYHIIQYKAALLKIPTQGLAPKGSGMN